MLRLENSTFTSDTDEYYPVLRQFRRLIRTLLEEEVMSSYTYEKTYLAVYYLFIGDTSQVSVFFLTNKNE